MSNDPRDDDDDRPRRRPADDEERGRDDRDRDDDDRPRRKRRKTSSSSGGDGTGKILLILFGVGFLCVLLCCGGFGVLAWIGSKEMKNENGIETDGLFANSLYSGDVDATYKNADPKFKKQYTQQQLKSFLDSHPKTLERDSLWGGTIQVRYGRGEPFKTIDSKPGGLTDPGVRIYFSETKDGKWVFVGMSPGLDEVIPSSLRFDPNKPEFD